MMDIKDKPAIKIRAIEQMRATRQSWNEIMSTRKLLESASMEPQQTVYCTEHEYVLRILYDDKEDYEYFGFVVRNVHVGKGRLFLEVYRMSEMECVYWPKVNVAQMGSQLPSAYQDFFIGLVNIVIRTGMTNIISVVDTPYKKIGELSSTPPKF